MYPPELLGIAAACTVKAAGFVWPSNLPDHPEYPDRRQYGNGEVVLSYTDIKQAIERAKHAQQNEQQDHWDDDFERAPPVLRIRANRGATLRTNFIRQSKMGHSPRFGMLIGI